MSRNLIDEVNEDKSLGTLATAPRMVAMNSKMFVIVLLLLIAILAQGWWINSANERAEMNTELMYVKLYPNGSWDIEYRNSGEEMDFFPLTVDKLISDYVIARFGVDPHNIRRDYGFSLVFMAQPLAADFVGHGKNQFNAAKAAEEAIKKGDIEEVSIRFVDHFDVSKGTFVQGDSNIYRTNVFIERIKKNSAGQVQGDPIKEVVNLHWRIRSVKELKKFTRDQLRANPIGLEILKDKISPDLSNQNT